MNSSIYWNVRRKVWSIQQKGRVVGHTKYLVLENVTFHVNENGRLKVIRDQRKSVHAKVKGRRVSARLSVRCATRVRYNPYRDKTFVTDSGRRIDSATLASFRPDGRLYVQR